MAKLDRFFFDHLKNVTQFDLGADKTGPLGLEGTLPLSADEMAILKFLQLESIFVCLELVNFLVGHTGTLKTVSMRG